MRRWLAVLALVSVGLATACGAASPDPGAQAVRAAVVRWLGALQTGNGRELCSVLTGRALQDALQTARMLGPRVTCAQAASNHPPRLGRAALAEVLLARRQAAVGQRIDAVRVDGDHATVRYSWIAPTHPSPILSYSRPRGGRVHDTVTLTRVRGRWKIG